jgi:N-acetylglucosamine malate deacetylase 2
MVIPNPVMNGKAQRSVVGTAEGGVTRKITLLADAGTERRKSVRQAARIVALETELRVLEAMTSADMAQDGAVPHGAVEVPRLRLTTVVRRPQDARFRTTREELGEALKQFDGDLEPAQGTARTLVVVAHPDDESVGAGVQLARLQDVTVLHVTDGARRAEGYVERLGFSSADEYREFRRREVRDALALAGIPEDRQLCLGIPDGEAPFHLVELALSLAELFDEMSPEIVLTHPYEGGHTDHDAVAFAVQLACGVLRREGAEVPVILELTSYHFRDGGRIVHDFLPHPGADLQRTVRLTPEAAELKERMYERFVTQRRCLEQFRTDLERFRPAPRYNFTAPPHDGTLDYELRSKRMSGAEWRNQAAKALERLRTRRRGWPGRSGAVSCRTWSAATTTVLAPATASG